MYRMMAAVTVGLIICKNFKNGIITVKSVEKNDKRPQHFRESLLWILALQQLVSKEIHFSAKILRFHTGPHTNTADRSQHLACFKSTYFFFFSVVLVNHWSSSFLL